MSFFLFDAVFSTTDASGFEISLATPDASTTVASVFNSFGSVVLAFTAAASNSALFSSSNSKSVPGPPVTGFETGSFDVLVAASDGELRKPSKSSILKSDDDIFYCCKSENPATSHVS